MEGVVERLERLEVSGSKQALDAVVVLQQRRCVAYSMLEQNFGQLRRSVAPALLGRPTQQQIAQYAEDTQMLLQTIASKIEDSCRNATQEFQAVNDEIKEICAVLESQKEMDTVRLIQSLQNLEKSKLQLVRSFDFAVLVEN
jgi:uncharacterized protein YchJ